MVRRPYANNGKWSITTRGFWAFPFAAWKLDDGTSTKNIVLFMFKRAVCKTTGRGQEECYSSKTCECFTTSRPYTSKEYPSAVGTGDFNQAKSMLFAGKARGCTTALLTKISSIVL